MDLITAAGIGQHAQDTDEQDFCQIVLDFPWLPGIWDSLENTQYPLHVVSLLIFLSILAFSLPFVCVFCSLSDILKLSVICVIFQLSFFHEQALYCWEMSLLRQGRPPVLHGSKVGLASIMTCSLYRHLLTIKPDFQGARTRLTELDNQAWLTHMKNAYREGADELIELEKRSGKNNPEKMARRIDILEEKWPLLCHVIEETIPGPEKVRQALVEAGGVRLLQSSWASTARWSRMRSVSPGRCATDIRCCSCMPTWA